MSSTHDNSASTPVRTDGASSAGVIPFFRAPAHLYPRDRKLFSNRIPHAKFLAALRNAPPPVRQNVARVLAAAETAAASGGTLVLVEGWRHNAVHRPNGHVRHVTGSWFCCLLLRALQRRGLTAFRGRVTRINRSRCTREEISAAASLAPGGLIGIAGSACPSRRRAAHYLRLENMRDAVVRTPSQALDQTGSVLTPEQEQCMEVCRLRGAEPLSAFLFECVNWAVHVVSRCIELLGGASPLPPEILLARRLRRDQSALTSPCR